MVDILNKNKKTKCLLVYSGGLDSTLAAKVLEAQGVEVTAINFVSYFFGSKQARETAWENNLKLIIHDDNEFKKKHWDLIQKPVYGHGKAINPCIDCHLLMFKTAGEMMKREGWDFIATGEVLGERPLSQNARALTLIEKECGIAGKLLRPLSAKLLEPTIPEKEGLVDREKLLDLSGRGRTRQIELAEKYGIKVYPTPAGGCILTEKNFAKKLRELMEKIGAENISQNEINLLKLGRHLWYNLEGKYQAKITIGRNQKEDEEMEKLLQNEDVLIVPKNFPGPSVLIRVYAAKDGLILENEAKRLIIKYSKGGKNVKFEDLFFNVKKYNCSCK